MELKAIQLEITDSELSKFRMAANTNSLELIRQLNVTPLVLGTLMPEIAANYNSRKPFMLNRGDTYAGIVAERDNGKLKTKILSEPEHALSQSREFNALEADAALLISTLGGKRVFRTRWDLDFKYVPPNEMQRPTEIHVDISGGNGLRMEEAARSRQRPVYMLIQSDDPDLTTRFWRDSDDTEIYIKPNSVIAYLGDITFHNGRINSDPVGSRPRKRSLGRVVL